MRSGSSNSRLRVTQRLTREVNTMKTRFISFAVSFTALVSATAAAQAPRPGPVQPPAVAPAPPAQPAPPPDQGGVTDRALPDRPRGTLEGLEPEAGGLTADEVARRALAASASVKEKRAQLEAANEKITETKFQFFPRTNLTASYTRTSPLSVGFGSGALVGAANAGGLTAACPAGTPGAAAQCPVVDSKGTPIGAQAFNLVFPNDNYLLDGHISVPISDYVLRLADATEASKSSKSAAKLLLEAEKAKVATDARSLYFNWLRAKAEAEIAKNAVQRTQARLQDAQATFAAGQISKADLLRIEALVANTQLVSTRADSMVALTTGQLAIVMEDPHPGYRIGEGIPPPAPVAESKAKVDDLIAEAQARRLEVLAIDETTKSLRSGASATRASALPKVEAIGDVVYANPNPRYFPPVQEWHATWSVGVQATWSVGDTFVNAASARELDAQARATLAQRKALHSGIAQEVLGAYLDLTRAQAAFETQQTALAAAEEGYRVTVDLFRAGRATSTDLVISESELLDAKLGDVNARIDLTIATIELRHATAHDLAATRPTAQD